MPTPINKYVVLVSLDFAITAGQVAVSVVAGFPEVVPHPFESAHVLVLLPHKSAKFDHADHAAQFQLGVQPPPPPPPPPDEQL